MNFIPLSYGGVWYWKRNDKERLWWKLCARRLKKLPNEMIEKIASYLYDAQYTHRMCKECSMKAIWKPVPRLGAYGGMTFTGEFECSAKVNDCKHIAPKRYPLGKIPQCIKKYVILK